jgi:hypothetical protein
LGGKDLGNEGVTAEKANSMVKEKQSAIGSVEPFFVVSAQTAPGLIKPGSESATSLSDHSIDQH